MTTDTAVLIEDLMCISLTCNDKQNHAIAKAIAILKIVDGFVITQRAELMDYGIEEE